MFSDNEQVVNPDGDVDGSFGVDIKAGIRCGSDETDFEEEGVDLLIPNASCLLEVIKRS
jgi:hypothetical protein